MSIEEDQKNTQNENTVEQIIHYKKINIFGTSKVGKSDLISFLENYSNKEFKITSDQIAPEQKNENPGETSSKMDLTQQIKRIKLNYAENKEMNLICYETNIENDYFIKINLDTLLSYSECILFMIDISNMESYKKVSELIPLIMKQFEEEKKEVKIPMFFISNKTDLEVSREVSGFEIKELLDKYQNIVNIEMTLTERNTVSDFVIKFVEGLTNYENEPISDSIHLVKIQDPPVIPEINNEKGGIDNNINLISLNLFLLGSSTVGKTSFIKRIFKNEFHENSLTTLGVDVEKTIAKVGDQKVKIEVWDTAGQERLRSIPKRYYSKGDGFLLLFDVTNKNTYDDVVNWIKDIREARGTTAPQGVNGVNNKDNSPKEVLFLIGNKIDDVNNRKVTKKEAIELAQSYNLKYYEVSCKQGVNTYEILNELIFEGFSNAKGNINAFSLKKTKTKKKGGKCC